MSLRTFFGWLVDAAKWVGQAVSDAVEWTGKAATDAFNWTKNAVKDAVEWTWKAVTDAWNRTKGAVKDVAKTVEEFGQANKKRWENFENNPNGQNFLNMISFGIVSSSTKIVSDSAFVVSCVYGLATKISAEYRQRKA